MVLEEVEDNRIILVPLQYLVELVVVLLDTPITLVQTLVLQMVVVEQVETEILVQVQEQ
tara:strand:- start:94 stop:270 length:177 start_codon:yes stop_codon:yes gene_type:complete